MKEYLVGGLIGLLFGAVLFWVLFVMKATKDGRCERGNLSDFQKIACKAVKYPSNLPPPSLPPVLP